jgi:hypothetical protein
MRALIDLKRASNELMHTIIELNQLMWASNQLMHALNQV